MALWGEQESEQFQGSYSWEVLDLQMTQLKSSILLGCVCFKVKFWEREQIYLGLYHREEQMHKGSDIGQGESNMLYNTII